MRLDEERAHLEDAATTSLTSTRVEPLGPRPVEASITVQTNAPNAVVRWDDETMPEPSFHVVVDGLPHRLEVSARGYATRQVEVVANGPHTVDVPLTRGRSRPR
jgi:hypothetical protein